MALAFSCAIVLLDSNPARAQSKSGATRLAPPTSSIQGLLANTEQFLKPSARDELVLLAGELQVRGFNEGARRLREQISSNDDDFERLIKKLLSHRAIGAGQALINDWRQRSPKSLTKQRFYSAVLYFASGEFELASRELDRLDEQGLGLNAGTARLLKRICEAERRGIKIGVERNPWSASFLGPSGKFEAGMLAPIELAKIDPNACDQLSALLALSPMQGNLWGLMGELLNAAGDVQGASAAYRRAESLGYTPRTLLEHRKILDDYLRKQQLNLTGTPAVSDKNPKQPNANQFPEQQKGLPSIAMNWVVGVGALMVVLLAGLQLREWFQKARRVK